MGEASAAAGIVAAIADRHRAGAGGGRPAVLVGLIGRGIGLSRSPLMHEREGERLGLRTTYALIDFDRHGLPASALPEVLAAAEAAGFAGINVTHPFKQAVIPFLTDLAADAAAVGAVNTVVLRAGRRTGHNTDCFGFAESFRREMAGCRLGAVVQFGAGGGGAAVAHALLDLGLQRLAIVDPDLGRAEGLAGRLARRFGRPVIALAPPDARLAEADGVVNASPVGMSKYPGAPFDTAVLAPGQWVADIVYFPPVTELLARARAVGCRTLGGAGMAVLQAVKAFELFTGIAPDREAMTRHFEAAA